DNTALSQVSLQRIHEVPGVVSSRSLLILDGAEGHRPGAGGASPVPAAPGSPAGGAGPASVLLVLLDRLLGQIEAVFRVRVTGDRGLADGVDVSGLDGGEVLEHR